MKSSPVALLAFFCFCFAEISYANCNPARRLLGKSSGCERTQPIGPLIGSRSGSVSGNESYISVYTDEYYKFSIVNSTNITIPYNINGSNFSITPGSKLDHKFQKAHGTNGGNIRTFNRPKITFNSGSQTIAYELGMHENEYFEEVGNGQINLFSQPRTRNSNSSQPPSTQNQAPSNNGMYVPLPVEPVTTYTDICVQRGEVVLIAENGVAFSKDRGFIKVGEKVRSADPSCAFDIVGKNRYCVDLNGNVSAYGTGESTGSCQPCKTTNLCN